MESLNLSCPRPTPVTVLPEPQLGNCAACGTPRFFLVPAFRPATTHLAQSLAGHLVLLFAAFVPAMLLAPMFAEKSSLNSTWRREATSLITYDPRPARKSNASNRPLAPRRLSTPLMAELFITPAVDESALPVAARANLVAQSPSPGIPMPPAATTSSLPVNLGVPMVPTVHVPSLDPAAPGAPSFPLARENTGGDPLGAVGAKGLLVEGKGGDRTGHGAPGLSVRPPRSAEARPQPEHAVFTKPMISFMPKPEYPPAALRDRIEGDVTVRVTFDKNGNIIFRGFVRQLGNEDLNSAARETVQQIRFAPATRDN